MVSGKGCSREDAFGLIHEDQRGESHDGVLGLLQKEGDIGDVKPNSFVSDVDDHTMKDFDVLVIVMVAVHAVPPSPPTPQVRHRTTAASRPTAAVMPQSPSAMNGQV